jgi:hypothetical protein
VQERKGKLILIYAVSSSSTVLNITVTQMKEYLPSEHIAINWPALFT